MKKITYTILIIIIIAGTFLFTTRANALPALQFAIQSLHSWANWELSERSASDVQPNISEGEIDVNIVADDVDKITEAQLVGEWVSVDDEKYKVSHGEYSLLEEYYDDELMSAGSWAFAETLPEKISEQYPNATNGPFLIKESDGETMFYIIESVTDTSLILIYLDRGNTLEFIRE